MIITLVLGCQCICLLDKGHEWLSNLIDVTLNWWQIRESNLGCSWALGLHPADAPKLLCAAFGAQAGLIPDEGVVMGMYLNTALCSPTTMFSHCPTFGSKLSVCTLFCLGSGWRNDLSSYGTWKPAQVCIWCPAGARHPPGWIKAILGCFHPQVDQEHPAGFGGQVIW